MLKFFVSKKNYIKPYKFYSTNCSYHNKPILFDRMFSSLFFGTIFTFWLTLENRLTYYGLEQKIEELKNEIKMLKSKTGTNP